MPQHSTPGAIMGTVGYMSPEQAQGKTNEIDQRSHLLFRLHPFLAVTGKNLSKVIQSSNHCTWSSMNRRRPSLNSIRRFAYIHAGLGDKERAFEWLEKDYTGRDDALTRLKAEPLFDSLRPDPRFTDLMRRVGLPR